MALQRIRRFTAPGGLLRLWDVVFDFPPAEIEDRIEAWCATYDGAAEGEWTRADIEDHVRDEHSTYTWVFEALAQRAGFHIETPGTPGTASSRSTCFAGRGSS